MTSRRHDVMRDKPFLGTKENVSNIEASRGDALAQSEQVGQARGTDVHEEAKEGRKEEGEEPRNRGTEEQRRTLGGASDRTLGEKT